MKKIHFMGVLGSGMKGVYELSKKMGYVVSGCDLSLDGHDIKHLHGIDLLVVSPAIFYQNKKNPELLEAVKKGIVMTWEEFVGKFLMLNKKVIAIAGTHGKSTTTAMLSKILIDAKLDPTVIIGAYVPEWNGNSRYGKGEYFVIEADEFNDNFLNYSPNIAVINNIEFDHPDYFESEVQVINSFNKFKNNLVGEKILITEKNSKNIHFKLSVFGEHNQKNANMAYIVSEKLGIKHSIIIKSLESFKGIGRRMELVAEVNGTKIFDDYAHHPSAIKTTLAGVRENFKDKKILAVIEPHGYKRTKALLKLYRNCFEAVDKVIIGPIFKARDQVDPSITPKLIAKMSNHSNIKSYETLSDLLNNDSNKDNLKSEITKFDIVIFMGAGNSSSWTKEILFSFKDLTTLKVGGKIKFYREISNEKDLKNAVDFAKKNNLTIFIIGGGSDIAVKDDTFNGLVIKYVSTSYKIEDDILVADAGMSWDKLVQVSVSNNLSGIECLSGIPGTVGASPIQNIGAYGQELSDTFVKLKAYDILKDKFVFLNKKECDFGYRESVFKQKKYWQRFVITQVTLKLKKYKDKDLSLQTIRDEIIRVRGEKLVDPNDVPNAGSFFKNPIVSKKEKERLSKKYPDIVVFPFNDKFKVSAGWLIEHAGWRGKSLGPVKVSDKHALVLTNPDGNGNFSDIKKIADTITSEVLNKFGILLEPEVQYI